MESTTGSCKTELIDQRATGPNRSGRREVERETADWVCWYNTERIHPSINHVTPCEYEAAYAVTLDRPAQAA